MIFRRLLLSFNLTIHQSMYDSNQYVFKQIKRVNDKEQKKDIRFFQQELKGIIGVVMSFKQEYTVFWHEKLILAKKLQKTKPLIFLKSLSTRLPKSEWFIEIAKGLKTLRVVANFNKSTNEHP